MEKERQTLIDQGTIESILNKLGYELIDCGNCWRSKALYRDGDNPTAIQIYKNTGVWIDFIHGDKKPKPFEALVRLSTKGDSAQLGDYSSLIKSESTVRYAPKKLIEMQKTYPLNWLEKLFPNYKFYENRGISKETQQFFKTGLASSGQMYRRMVFPIFDEHGQIVGFSGRRVDENHFAKWKHIGRKTQWIYPSFVPSDFPVDKIIDKEGHVFLVESIGDAMALFEQRIKNVLVIFGTSVSGSVINYLCSKNLSKIYICTNNDFQNTKNEGLLAAFKAYIKLSGFFNLDQLEIKMPPKPYNDFGMAHENDSNFKEWKQREINQEEQRKKIFEFVEKHQTLFSETQVKKFLKLNE